MSVRAFPLKLVNPEITSRCDAAALVTQFHMTDEAERTGKEGVMSQFRNSPEVEGEIVIISG
jgi:hypothetical protein